MSYAQRMQVFDPLQYLVIVGGRVVLRNALSIDNLLKEVASICVFHDKEQLLLLLDDFIQLDYVLVLDLLQDLNLSTDALYIGLLAY